jgi:hypothetical protein
MAVKKDENPTKNGSKLKKPKTKRWDTVLVGVGMTVGFCIIVMKITSYWPCDIAMSLHIMEISCQRSLQENIFLLANSILKHVSSIVGLLQQKLFVPHFLLQSLQNI